MDTIISSNTPKAESLFVSTNICLAVDKMLRDELRYVLRSNIGVGSTDIAAVAVAIEQADSPLFIVTLRMQYAAPWLNIGRPHGAGAYVLHVTSDWKTCSMVSTYLQTHVRGNLHDAVASLAATKAAKRRRAIKYSAKRRVTNRAKQKIARKEAAAKEVVKRRADKAAAKAVLKKKAAQEAALAAQRTPKKLREAQQAKNRLTARLAREKREEARNAVVVLAAKEKERDA